MHNFDHPESPPTALNPTDIANQEQQDLAKKHTVSADLNLSTADALVPTSVVEKSGNDYLKLKDPTNLKDPNLTFQVQTLDSDLLVRDSKGNTAGSLNQSETVKPTGKFLVFETSEPKQKVLMLEVRKADQSTPLGLVAAPYLKLSEAQPTPQSSVAAVPQNSPETTTNSQEIAATKAEELLLIGDSITEGINSTRPKFAVNYKSGRPTSGHLKELQTLFANKKFPKTVKSVVIYGAINDLGPQGTGSVDKAVDNISQMITLLKSHGIQPVVSTMFQTLASSKNSPEQDPLNQKVQTYNQKITDLANNQKIPLINFAKIPNPSTKIHPGRQVYQQMTDLINQSYERPTS